MKPAIYNTFSINLKNHLSMNWFYIEVMVLNPTPFTKEPLKSRLFESVKLAKYLTLGYSLCHIKN